MCATVLAAFFRAEPGDWNILPKMTSCPSSERIERARCDDHLPLHRARIFSRIAYGDSAPPGEVRQRHRSRSGAHWPWSPGNSPAAEIHLENMLELMRLGVRIVPAHARFYQRPE